MEAAGEPLHSIEYEVKLQALLNSVTSLIRPYRQGYDRGENLHYFERYRALRTGLQQDFSRHFGDLPPFEIPPTGVTMSGTTRDVIRREDVEQMKRDMEYCLEVLGGISIEPERGHAAEPTERLFGAGEEYDAHRVLVDILGSAASKLRIADNFIDERVFVLLSDTNPKVIIEVLTREVTPKVQLAAEKFEAQYGNLSVRVSDAFHDRFLMIDDRYYHLGPSIKDAGKRVAMFSKIEEPAIISLLEKEWEEAWKKARAVI